MSTSTKLTLATLGGPETFAGQAAVTMKPLLPDVGDPVYVADGDDLFAALRNGDVDVAIAAEASTSGGFSGFLDPLVAAPGSELYVLAEASVPFACSILGRPGARLDDLVTVYGGPVSLGQAEPYLAEHLPGAATVTYTAPFDTARQIAEGDGREAVLGTSALGRRFGLEELATNVDGGAAGNFWALSRVPRFVDRPDRIVVAARCGSDGALGDIVGGLAAEGFRLLSACAQPTGGGLLEFDYVLRLAGPGDRSAVESALSRFPSTRLAGAFRAPE